MSDVTPDVEALVNATRRVRGGTVVGLLTQVECQRILEALPALLRSDSPAGDALRDRLGVWEVRSAPDATWVLSHEAAVLRIPDGAQKRYLRTEWEPTP